MGTTTLPTEGPIKKAENKDIVANSLESTLVAEFAKREDSNRNQTPSCEKKKAADTATIEGIKKVGSSKSDLPLSDLFKSMKTAFTTNGEAKSKVDVRKKSLEFLSNSLMKKAVAKSLSPPKVSAEEHPSTASPPPPATPAPVFTPPTNST